jgi:hypothetical protein
LFVQKIKSGCNACAATARLSKPERRRFNQEPRKAGKTTNQNSFDGAEDSWLPDSKISRTKRVPHFLIQSRNPEAVEAAVSAARSISISQSAKHVRQQAANDHHA